MAFDKNKIIARAQELAQLVFSGNKKKADAHLAELTQNGKLSWLQRELDKVQKIIENMPEFLSSSEGIEAMIIYDEEQQQLTNNRFREWYLHYAHLKKKYTSFISDIEPFESLYFREDILHAEYLFETDFKENIIYGPENPYEYELGILTSKVWIVLIAFRKLQTIKEDYFNQLIKQIESPVKGNGLGSNLTIEQKRALYQKLIYHGYIANTDEDNFLAALGSGELPATFRPIKWKIKTKFNFHDQESLGALLTATGIVTIDRSRIKSIFLDYEGKPFILRKLKKTDDSFQNKEKRFRLYFK